MMRFQHNPLIDYAAAHTSPPTDLLYRLYRETNLKILCPQMLSGHLQGTFLKMISQLARPQQVLEIGTFTGYATICLAAGLAPNGCIHTIDINEELEDIQTKYFTEAGILDSVKCYYGTALEIIPQIEAQFDLVFIDADKINYVNYYEIVFDQVKSGGFILADNVLWNGKVIEDINDWDTAALVEFNQKVQEDERVENLLLPFRDGIMMVRKK